MSRNRDLAAPSTPQPGHGQQVGRQDMYQVTQHRPRRPAEVRWPSPPLTTVRQPLAEISMLAAHTVPRAARAAG
ncbi:hypothetical protein [Polymorphospora rubra]|uniref:hypothetical protein n=1 Tax=Polymorphospora rubra TaxID=338584 RepID=UPI001BB3ED74|nr:hypothetical protein [Polymorphospora rubra]